MTPADPHLRQLAARLLALENDRGLAVDGTSAFRVCGRLGVLLTKLAGAAGFRSLLSRALALARAEEPWLMAVRVDPDGSLVGLEHHGNNDELLRGEIALVAQLLGLLHVFIGEALTDQLLKEAWPDASIQPGAER
jgi:hypothetical protein